MCVCVVLCCVGGLGYIIFIHNVFYRLGTWVGRQLTANKTHHTPHHSQRNAKPRTVAYSTEMTPPPMTASESGSVLRLAMLVASITCNGCGVGMGCGHGGSVVVGVCKMWAGAGTTRQDKTKQTKQSKANRRE